MKFFQTSTLYILYLLHLFLGINGCIGGCLLMLRNDGSLLGMEANWLEHSPFPNYSIPGFFLFSFLGILPLLTAIGLMGRFNWPGLNALNIYVDRHWAWTFSIYTGVISITWIAIQLMLTNYFWLQPIILLIGVLIIVCTMIPSTMRRYRANSDDHSFGQIL